jgi:hypothetical protein
MKLNSIAINLVQSFRAIKYAVLAVLVAIATSASMYSALAETIPANTPPVSPIKNYLANNVWTSDVDGAHYSTSFPPGAVTYDETGRPYILKATKIWTINDANTGWEARDIAPALQLAWTNWDGTVDDTHPAMNRIRFDGAGDAYVHLHTAYHTRDNTMGQHTLAFSTDKCRTWKIYLVPFVSGYGWQAQDQNTDMSVPPTMVYRDFNNVVLSVITKNGSGSAATLSIAKYTVPGSTNCFGPLDYGNMICARNNKIHVSWASQVKATLPPTSSLQNTNGTACYAITFDRATQTFSSRTFLGYAGATIDDHNIPVLTTTSDAKVHAILCGHIFNYMFHLTANAANSTAGFGAPEAFGANGITYAGSFPYGGSSYTSLVCDRNDVLQVAVRQVGQGAGSQGFFYNLASLRKDTRAGTAWTANQYLAYPARTYYQNYQHRMSYNAASDRLCLSFAHYPNFFSLSEYNAYVNTFPGDNVQAEAAPTGTARPYYVNVQTHWPVDLLSSDGGASWKIASTADFIQGIKPPIADGTYTITARHSGSVLDVSGFGTANGSNVQQWHSTGASNQRWIVTSLGEGHYKIKGVQSGRLLQVSGASTANGANVDIWDDTNASNQKWAIIPKGGGSYQIINMNSRSALDVTGSSTADGANVQQWGQNNGNNQQWSFTP